jgi:hypothetical protein
VAASEDTHFFPTAKPNGGLLLEARAPVACALGYLDFRLKGAWRHGHPKLVAWLDSFAERTPAFGQSMPED